MRQFTLRQRFSHGLLAVIAVGLLTMNGGRLMAKAALFHYLEREYMVNIFTLSSDLESVAVGKATVPVQKSAVIRSLDRSNWISSQADIELFGVEQTLFSILGFGRIFELPHESIRTVDQIRAEVTNAPGETMTPALVAVIRPNIDTLLAKGEVFAPLVRDAGVFIARTVFVLNLLGIVALLATILAIRRAALGRLDLALAVAGKVAKGDLTATIDPGAKDEVGRLLEALAEMQCSLSRVVGDVRLRSSAVNASMAELSSGTADLSERTSRQSSALQSTASTVRTIAVMAKGGNQQMNEANTLARGAREVAGRGGAAVARVVQSMDDISSASKKITDITSVIDGIAFQTNILALNAAVEAARAGEQGRGFAVVASEVRTLAQRSAAAAKEIAGLIQDTGTKVDAGSLQASEARRTIDEVVDAVRGVDELIAEVTKVFSDHDGGIESIERAIVEMDGVTQQNAALCEQSAAASDLTLQQSEALVQSVAVFSLPAR